MYTVKLEAPGDVADQLVTWQEEMSMYEFNVYSGEQSKSVGFEIGVRRTLHMTVEQAWQWVTSLEGVALWLTQVDAIDFSLWASYHSADGSHGVVRVFEPLSNLRVSYQPSDWKSPSSIQVQVMAKGRRTIIAFYEEHLASYAVREQRLAHFRAAFNQLEASLAK